MAAPVNNAAAASQEAQKAEVSIQVRGPYVLSLLQTPRSQHLISGAVDEGTLPNIGLRRCEPINVSFFNEGHQFQNFPRGFNRN